jgi:hypothetical protein
MSAQAVLISASWSSSKRRGVSASGEFSQSSLPIDGLQPGALANHELDVPAEPLEDDIYVSSVIETTREQVAARRSPPHLDQSVLVEGYTGLDHEFDLAAMARLQAVEAGLDARHGVHHLASCVREPGRGGLPAEVRWEA